MPSIVLPLGPDPTAFNVPLPAIVVASKRIAPPLPPPPVAPEPVPDEIPEALPFADMDPATLSVPEVAMRIAPPPPPPPDPPNPDDPPPPPPPEPPIIGKS